MIVDTNRSESRIQTDFQPGTGSCLTIWHPKKPAGKSKTATPNGAKSAPTTGLLSKFDRDRRAG